MQAWEGSGVLNTHTLGMCVRCLPTHTYYYCNTDRCRTPLRDTLALPYAWLGVQADASKLPHSDLLLYLLDTEASADHRRSAVHSLCGTTNTRTHALVVKSSRQLYPISSLIAERPLLQIDAFKSLLQSSLQCRQLSDPVPLCQSIRITINITSGCR